ncbi:hypothetical protein COB57_02185 [Candidatus Peregrinibacteria bacterium]|nr:MAG: hypothetical protein COB57_02185 [Candidatus Peregrinibacteria bacterium]
MNKNLLITHDNDSDQNTSAVIDPKTGRHLYALPFQPSASETVLRLHDRGTLMGILQTLRGGISPNAFLEDGVLKAPCGNRHVSLCVGAGEDSADTIFWNGSLNTVFSCISRIKKCMESLKTTYILPQLVRKEIENVIQLNIRQIR